jgi:REP element-mobilizing transposase RayT
MSSDRILMTNKKRQKLVDEEISSILSQIQSISTQVNINLAHMKFIHEKLTNLHRHENDGNKKIISELSLIEIQKINDATTSDKNNCSKLYETIWTKGYLALTMSNLGTVRAAIIKTEDEIKASRESANFFIHPPAILVAPAKRITEEKYPLPAKPVSTAPVAIWPHLSIEKYSQIQNSHTAPTTDYSLRDSTIKIYNDFSIHVAPTTHTSHVITNEDLLRKSFDTAPVLAPTPKTEAPVKPKTNDDELDDITGSVTVRVEPHSKRRYC